MYRLRWIFTTILMLAISACANETQAIPTATAELIASPRPSKESTQQPAKTLTPSPIPVLESPFPLIKVSNQVQAYPGPQHYAGDVLTFEVPVQDHREPPEVAVSLTLDGGKTVEVGGQWTLNKLLIPLALDTSSLSGSHEIRIQVAEDSSVDASYQFEVLPADQRPQQEIGAKWESLQISCCTIHYITNTAAARDLEIIADHAQQAADDFALVTGIDVMDQLDIYLMDRMWGNGAFAGQGELLMAYTDRYYGPAQDGTGLETIFRHEFTHAARVDATAEGFFPFNEGLAVYIAGGHYKPEPIPERGAAMLELGYQPTLDSFVQQHEMAYLHGASIMAYIVEEYGWHALMEFGRNASGGRFFDPDQRDQILQDIFGVSSNTFESSYLAWLESHEPGEQIDDLRLTIALQDLRRQYQRDYAPEPASIFGESDEKFARPDYLPMLIRESDSPQNVAAELMIANAQKVIVTGDYDQAESLIEAIRDVLDSGEFTFPLAYDYASVTSALSEKGYEALSLYLRGDEATAQVTRASPSLEQVTLRRVNGEWQIVTGQ
jgi:hypothetical protein